MNQNNNFSNLSIFNSNQNMCNTSQNIIPNNNFNNFNPNPYTESMITPIATRHTNTYNPTNTHVSNMYNNYNPVNVPESATLIEKTNFKNPDNTIHNNLGDILLSENITEYQINIDSDDRCLDTYPSPFCYSVSFKALGPSTEKKYSNFKQYDNNCNKIIDPIDKIYYPGTPGPVIMRSFKNVKFVKIRNVIISKSCIQKYLIKQCIFIDKKCSNKFKITKTTFDKICSKDAKCTVCFHTTCVCNIPKFKFLIMKIKELQNDRIYSTNTAASDNAFILLLDKTYSNGHNTWTCPLGTIYFRNSSLHNINRLTFDFYDSRGCKLEYGIVIEYNLEIDCAGEKYLFKTLILFGDFNCHTVSKIINSCSFVELKYNCICRSDQWCNTLLNNILLQIEDECFLEQIKENYSILLTQLLNLNIHEILKCSLSTNIFLVIGVKENELNTLTNYS
jgi:hypothetical protein